ncbi:hypothetical protein GpartN1_g775.t1 [Galdieria partita]|uniref:B-block binding subunit of TFIIIC domain-containing protein n=1 Tax=Galdieria partita TaxID=83374 RepID=A0A9C7PR78_9RHOD|nr:hypothetical protein GpartN1_g775.t1 [Galdieria partita]
MDLYLSLIKKELALSKDGLTLEEAVRRVGEYAGYLPPFRYDTLSHLLDDVLTREEFKLESGPPLVESLSGLSDDGILEFHSHSKKNIHKGEVEEKPTLQQLLNSSISCSEAVFLRVCGFSELDQAQISSESFRILTIIAKHSHQGGICQSYLAKLSSVDPHTLHHHIRVLRNMRLITRKREIRNSGDNNKPMKTYKICMNFFRFKSDGSNGDEPALKGQKVRQETLKFSQETMLEICESTDPNTSDAEVLFDYTVYLRIILRTLFNKEGYTMVLNSLKEEFLQELEERFFESKEHSMRSKALRYWRNAINKLEEKKMIQRFVLNANDEKNSEEIEHVRLRLVEQNNEISQSEEEFTALHYRLLWERTLEFQVLALIIEFGERGISQREMLSRLGCKASRKIISSVCRGLMTNLGVKAKSLQEGKQAVYYYVAPEHFRYLDLNNTDFVGMKKFLENSDCCSNTQQVTNLQNELRTKNLLEHIKQEKVLNLSDLGHFLATWEGASFSRVDKKTVKRLIQRLQDAGLVKIVSVDMPHILERESPQQILLVTLPEVREDSAEIEEFLRKWSCSSGWKKTIANTRQGIKANASKKVVLQSSRDHSSIEPDEQESSRDFVGLGKMLHGRRLHLHLFQCFVKSQQSFSGSSETMQLDVVIKTMKTEDFLELFGDSSCMHWIPLEARQFPINALPENIATKLFRSRPVNRKLSLLVDLLERLQLLSKCRKFQCVLTKEIEVCGFDDSAVKFTFHEKTDVDKFWFYLQRNCLLLSSKRKRMLRQHQAYDGEYERKKLCLHNLFPEAYNRKQWCDKIWKLPRHSRSELYDSVKSHLLQMQDDVTHDSLCELSEYFQLDICEIFTEAIREANASRDRMNPIRRDSFHDENLVPQSMNRENVSSRTRSEKVASPLRKKRRTSLDPPNIELGKQAFSEEEVSTSQGLKDSSEQRTNQRKKRSVRTSWTDSQDRELIIHVFDQKISEMEKSLGVSGNCDIHSVLHAKVKSWDAVGLKVGHSGKACKRRFLSLYKTLPYNDIISQLCQYVVDSWRNNCQRNFQTKVVLENLLPLDDSVDASSKINSLNSSAIEDIPNSVEELLMQYDIENLNDTATSSVKFGKESKQEQQRNDASVMVSLSPKMVAIEELIKLVLRESEDTYIPEKGMSILNRFTEEELKVALEDLRQRGIVVSQRADRHNREYSVSSKILKITSENPFGKSFHDDFTCERKSFVDNASLDKDIIVDKDNHRSGSIAAILSLASTGIFQMRPNVDKAFFETIKAKGLSKSVGSGGIGFHLKQYSDTIRLSHVSSREDIPEWSIDLIPLDVVEVFMSRDDCNTEEQLNLPLYSFNGNVDCETEFSLSVVASYSEVKMEEIQLLVEEIDSLEENGMTMKEMMDLHPNWTKLQAHQVLQGLVHLRTVYVSFIHGDEVRFLSQRFAQRFLLPKANKEKETASQEMIPFPWTNLAGEIDTNSLIELQYWILYVVMSHPGIEENRLWNILRESEVPLASVRTIIEWLERDGRISKLQRFVDNAGSVTYYVPEQNCMGSIAQ